MLLRSFVNSIVRYLQSVVERLDLGPGRPERAGAMLRTGPLVMMPPFFDLRVAFGFRPLG
jgi:hypothetical protein